MKLKFIASLVCMLVVSCFSQMANAALVLTVGTGTFAPNSGIQAIDILVRSKRGGYVFVF